MDTDRKRRSDKEGNRKEITRTAIFNLTYVIELCTAHCTCSTFGTKQAHLPFPLLPKGCCLRCERLLQRQVGQRDDKNACRIPRFPGRDMPLTPPPPLFQRRQNAGKMSRMQAGEKKSVGEGDRGSTSLSLRHPSIQFELKYDGPSKYHSGDATASTVPSHLS